MLTQYKLYTLLKKNTRRRIRVRQQVFKMPMTKCLKELLKRSRSFSRFSRGPLWILQLLTSKAWCQRPPFKWSNSKSWWTVKKQFPSFTQSYQTWRSTPHHSKIKLSLKELSCSVTTLKMRASNYWSNSSSDKKTSKPLSLKTKQNSSRPFLKTSKMTSKAFVWKSVTPIGQNCHLMWPNCKENPFYWMIGAESIAPTPCMRLLPTCNTCPIPLVSPRLLSSSQDTC